MKLPMPKELCRMPSQTQEMKNRGCVKEPRDAVEKKKLDKLVSRIYVKRPNELAKLQRNYVVSIRQLSRQH
jgi:predicted Zn-dependent protease with MMP-like domain